MPIQPPSISHSYAIFPNLLLNPLQLQCTCIIFDLPYLQSPVSAHCLPVSKRFMKPDTDIGFQEVRQALAEKAIRHTRIRRKFCQLQSS